MSLTRVPTNMVSDLFSFKNRVINGDMRIAQRSSVSLTTSNQYGQVDRFTCSLVGTGLAGTLTQEVNGLASSMPSRRALRFNNISFTSGYIVLRHRIEAVNCIDLNSSTVTVQAKIFHDFGVSVAVRIGLRMPTSATADDWSAGSSATSTSDSSVSVPSGATTLVSSTFTLNSTDASRGLELVIYCDPLTVSAKNFLVSDVQLEAGRIATEFERRAFGLELSLCQRYYEVGHAGYEGYNTSSAFCSVAVQFKVTKRVNPVITEQMIGSSGITGTFSSSQISGEGYWSKVTKNTTTGNLYWQCTFTAAAEL